MIRKRRRRSDNSTRKVCPPLFFLSHQKRRGRKERERERERPIQFGGVAFPHT